MSLKHTLKELFTFSKKERIGNIILICLIIIVALLPFFRQSNTANDKMTTDDSLWLASASQIQQNGAAEIVQTSNEEAYSNPSSFSVDKTISSDETPTAVTLFYFDPNTLDANGFKKLGLRDKTIRTLLNYRNKGGRFRKPEDLAKIYGLQPQEFERLRPFVSIASIDKKEPQPYPTKLGTENNMDFQKAKPAYQPKTIDINAADIAAFESLYGIGNKLATKIVNFRTKLGGFYRIEQVGETYGVPESTFLKIKPQLQVSHPDIKKIDINTAGYEDINNHPYINSRTAYQILKHRKEKGNFSSMEEVKSLIQPDDSFEKIAPYIKIN